MSTSSSYCVYNYCRNCVNNSEKTIAFFKFPVNDQKRTEEWVKNCGNISIASMDIQDLRNRKICEEHFLAKDILISSKCKQLTKTQFP